MAYSKKVIQKFEDTLREPEKHSVGRWDPTDSDIGTGMVGAPACGDVMRLQIKCEKRDNSHIINDVKSILQCGNHCIHGRIYTHSQYMSLNISCFLNRYLSRSTGCKK